MERTKFNGLVTDVKVTKVAKEVKEVQIFPASISSIKKQCWKKKGYGTYIFQGQKLQFGDIFYADEKEIPAGHRDLFVPVNPEEGTKEPYMERFAGAWWNVFDGSGTVINDRGLRKEDAEKLLKLTQDKLTKK